MRGMGREGKKSLKQTCTGGGGCGMVISRHLQDVMSAWQKTEKIRIY